MEDSSTLKPHLSRISQDEDVIEAAWPNVTLSAEFHSEFEGFHVALAVLSGLFDEELAVADNETDETLVAEHVRSLRVSVRQPSLRPLAQTAVLALCKFKHSNKDRHHQISSHQSVDINR